MSRNVSNMFTSISDAVTKEPNNDRKLNPFNSQWKTAYFESCDPITDGLIYCCCSCICTGILHSRSGEHFCSCLLPTTAVALRTKIRMAYGIQGTLIEDCLAGCCSPCFLLQMKKELDHQGVPDPLNRN